MTIASTGTSQQSKTDKSKKEKKKELTNLIQLQRRKIRSQLIKQLLRSIAVRTIRLGEDNNAILINQSLGLGLGGGHGGG